jgi:hypothetical protein
MKHWTDDERNVLKKNYYAVTPEELDDLLPGRSRSSIYNQVFYLRTRGWTFNQGPKGVIK